MPQYNDGSTRRLRRRAHHATKARERRALQRELDRLPFPSTYVRTSEPHYRLAPGAPLDAEVLFPLVVEAFDAHGWLPRVAPPRFYAELGDLGPKLYRPVAERPEVVETPDGIFFVEPQNPPNRRGEYYVLRFEEHFERVFGEGHFVVDHDVATRREELNDALQADGRYRYTCGCEYCLGTERRRRRTKGDLALASEDCEAAGLRPARALRF